MLWGGELKSLQWFICEGFLIYAFILLKKKIVLKRNCINSLLSQKTVNTLAFSIKISCKQLLHYLCWFTDVVPV